MPRRRVSMVDVLLVLPWWISVVAAAFAYALFGLNIVTRHAAPYVTAFFLLMAFLSIVRAYFIKRRFDALQSIEHIRQLPWRQFESIVGEAFRRRGYGVQENPVDGPDGGVDLQLEKDNATFYVQCKQWKQTKVGVKAIRELYGVMAARGAAGGFFVASGEYTQEARNFARQCGIELIDGTALAAMITNIHPAAGANPTCPACGEDMVRRTARRGVNVGREFWGCSSYPRCRATRPVQTFARDLSSG